jgi:SAM-dependent methyltransferase
MGNKNIDKYYTEMSKNISDPIATRNNAKDFSKYDISLMKKWADPIKDLLDLGSGTGLLINHLDNDFNKIVAVEKYPNLSKFIKKTKKIELINDDLLTLKLSSHLKFDVVSIFGVMNFFNREEAVIIYQKVLRSLKKEGVLIVKNQFGLKDDVTVNGYSKELKTDYYSEYRQIDNEISLLENIGFKEIKVIDIYPAEYNRWKNTHFYALICAI